MMFLCSEGQRDKTSLRADQLSKRGKGMRNCESKLGAHSEILEFYLCSAAEWRKTELLEDANVTASIYDVSENAHGSLGITQGHFDCVFLSKFE